jgi:hypothetical protein
MKKLTINAKDAKLKGANICTDTEYIADFQINENYVQDLYVYKTKKNVANDKILIDKTLRYRSLNKHQNMMWPQFPAFGAEPKGWDNLFKITFTLSPQV